MPNKYCHQCASRGAHREWCTLAPPKTERELGWNEAIDEAAEAVRECLTTGLLTSAQAKRAIERVTRLKK